MRGLAGVLERSFAMVVVLGCAAHGFAQEGVPQEGVPQEGVPQEGTPPEAAEPEVEHFSLGAVAVAVAPTRAASLPLDQVPSNVQHLDRATLEADRSLGLHQALNARLGSVTLSDVQNNPLQPDLQFRGFTASPLLGAPQGIAVYQNGVRIHDPFGDVVQWDLLPEDAVLAVDLVPGANPLYGQNALGAGLALHMKDGFHAPGYRVEGYAGSFGRYKASAEYGDTFGHGGDWAAYGNVSEFGEEGFRDAARSSAEHGFFDLRQRTPAHELGINATLARTSLNGNGPAPIELLARDRAAVFTFPDNTENHLLMLSADAKRRVAEHAWLSGTAYFRHASRATLNADATELAACAADTSLRVCDEDGAFLLTETGAEIELPSSGALFDGVFNTTDTSSLGYGASLQASTDVQLASRPNQLIVGGNLDASSVAFLQRVELGQLTDARSVDGAGVFVANDGFRTELDVRNQNAGLYVLDTFEPLDALSLQAGGRVGLTHIELIDRAGTALNGDHSFARFNPSAGITVKPAPPVALFASYGESSRAPSAIELACADENEPCRVPNAFLADPPLEQVVTRSIELGMRGAHDLRTGGASRSRSRRASPPRLEWSAAIFGSRNFDDILFVAGSQVGTGYFRNAGQTQRVGLELSASSDLGPLQMYASYTLLRATFESSLSLPAGANPAVEEGEPLSVKAGDRMPGIPMHSLKAGITVQPWPSWELGVATNAQSSRPYRGDEANLIDPVDGFAVVSAHLAWWLMDELQAFVNVENLLDAEYSTFGLLAEPDEVLPGASDPRFLGPGAPIGIWAGLVLRGP